MYNEVIKLVKETKTVNEFGDVVATTSEREVFAKLQSIGQKEFYEASAVGLKPEIKFVLPDFLEWKGEEKILYTPYGGTEQEYRVLRTYQHNNLLELTCYRGVEK